MLLTSCRRVVLLARHGRPLSTRNWTKIRPNSTHAHVSHPKQASFPLESQMKLGAPGVRNQIIFGLLGSLAVFAYAAENTNAETDTWTKRVKSSLRWAPITNAELRKLQQVEFVKSLRTQFAKVQETVTALPLLLRPWITGFYLAVAQPYADASEGKRICWKICLLNTGIFLAWQIPRLQPVLRKTFMHNPLSGLSYTMFTSTFSHRGFLHLLFNCIALEGFGSSAAVYLSTAQHATAPEQLESTSTYHFTAFFIAAGAFASLVAHAVDTKFLYPRMVSRIFSASSAKAGADTWASAVVASSARPAAAAAATAAPPRILPSLGASGAVYACVTMTALAFPTSQVALIIPPSYPMDIWVGVGGLLAFDTLGALKILRTGRGFFNLGHFAHLGGAAFGVAYYYNGPHTWSWLRETVKTEQKPLSQT
ncbi:hypothetical protein CYLTODRAFT_425905 [Cylindrobasidium torrendii FP15055 ss-10]|uniref:Peptidase S54 rhomboid domain-containing protein n=1 Tax=Cylindrobasidium torrendii FP15055 ss-10 TaxID=1314674 RepID=A0A0D7B287_9AGAR|nr:hypothetical protein CYLTODRAFT_425905 [Cylindrobasidium torrendii FP15055 ss-10]